MQVSIRTTAFLALTHEELEVVTDAVCAYAKKKKQGVVPVLARQFQQAEDDLAAFAQGGRERAKK